MEENMKRTISILLIICLFLPLAACSGIEVKALECPSCHEINVGDRNFCSNCGEAFHVKEDATQTSNKNVKDVLSASEIYELVAPSVVEITGTSMYGTSTGTGFFYDAKGTVVTNYHVIEDCNSATIELNSGKSYEVTKVLGYSAERDIAILQTECSISAPLTVRNTEVKTGETVYAIGSSLGLTGSLSDGIISSANREIDGLNYIQTTAPISHGNSGGPLIDEKGQVIGITTAYFSEGQNLNLAIHIGEVSSIDTKHPIALSELFDYSNVEWLKDWEIQYEDALDAYVLLFELSDEQEVPVSSSGIVEITIVNSDNVTVYDEKRTFTETQFDYWYDEEDNEYYLAAIYIYNSVIKPGTASTGTVYFTVYGNDYSFDECSVEIYDLPNINSSQISGSTVGVRTIAFSDKFTAEYALASWENGEATEESMIDLMNRYGADQGGGMLHVISRGDYVDEIDEWCFDKDRKVGDYAIIENIYGFSLCYISSVNFVSTSSISDFDEVGVQIKTSSLDTFSAEYNLLRWKGSHPEATEEEFLDYFGGEYTVITRDYSNAKIVEWCFDPERKVGDCKAIKTTEGCIVYYILSINYD